MSDMDEFLLKPANGKDDFFMQHHAFVIEAGAEEGIGIAHAWIKRELKTEVRGNIDIIVLRHGLLSVDDVRRTRELSMQTAIGTEKILIIAASHAYHEAQNALLRLFEEPPVNTYLFLILPTLGGLLQTVRSRVMRIDSNERTEKLRTSEESGQFLLASHGERSAIAKKLVSGKDEEKRRENRDEAIALVNGIEMVIYEKFKQQPGNHILVALLSDIAILRGYLYARSAPVRMILEHLSLIIPEGLV